MKLRTWAIVLLVALALAGAAFGIWWFSKARWIALVRAKYGKSNPALNSAAFPWHDYSRQQLMELYRTGKGLAGTGNAAIVV